MILTSVETLLRPTASHVQRLVGAFLRHATHDLADGAHALAGDDVVARVMTYVTRPRREAVLEAHRAFIDVQMLLDGVERAQWYPAATLRPSVAYDTGRDVEFFHQPARAPAQFTLARPLCAVFFPGDAHCTQLQLRTPRTVRKIVVKIRQTLWT